MALDLNSANIITEGLERHGGWYLSALLIIVVVWQALVARKDRADAHKAEVDALKTVIPLAEKLAFAVSVLNSRGRKPERPAPPVEAAE